MDRTEFTRRAAVVGVVAVLVVLAAIGLPQVLGPGSPAGPVVMDTDEWEGSMAVEPLDTQGRISPDVPDGEGKTVLIDASHGNRIENGDVQPLVRTLHRYDYDVRRSEEVNLTRALAGADAFVVIDPAAPYGPEETEALRNFTEDGGRLLVLTEPDRKTIQVGQFGSASISTVESDVDRLLGAYDVTVDPRYVYNQAVNDGNYQDVVADAADGAELEGGEYALPVAAPVYAPDAEPLLVLPSSSRLARTDARGEYVVAVRQGNLVVVGDSSFLASGQQNVGDNERFVAYLVEFLAAGDHADAPPPTATATPTPTGTGNGTATPTEAP
jgi:hypothetical protein